MALGPEQSAVRGFDSLPSPLKEFSAKLYSDLANFAVDAFSLLRWRFALSGPVRPYVSHNFEWSDDQQIWHSLPRKISLRLIPTVQRRLRNEDAAGLAAMFSSGVREPLSHVLIRDDLPTLPARQLLNGNPLLRQTC